MKGLTTCLDTFKIVALSQKCRHGFGPSYCTTVMCDDGNILLDCCFVQEWIMLNKQATFFGQFWKNIVLTE